MTERLRTLSKFFLITVNLILAVISLAILGGGLYVYLNYNIFSEFLSEEAILYVASSGAIVFLFCLLGLIGACCDQAKFLCPYLVLIVLLIGAEVLVGIVTLNYLGVLDSTAGAVDTNSTLDATETAINNFILKTYHTCCVLNTNFCSVQVSDPNFCRDVLFCDDLLPPPCIDETGASRSKVVDQALCTALQGFNLEEGSTLVGPAPESCGGGDPGNYIDDLIALVKSQLEIAGYIAIGLGVVEILIVLFTTYLLFKGEEFSINRAFSKSNYAVAVAQPVNPNEIDLSQVRQSIATHEEFEVDLDAVGRSSFDQSSRQSADRSQQRLSVDRRSIRHSNARETEPYV